MGHQTLMITLLASLLLSAGIFVLIENWKSSSGAIGSQFEREQAVNVSGSAVNLALSKLRLNKNWRTGFSNLSVSNGTCSLTVSDIGMDSVLITAVGQYRNVSHTSVVRAKLFSIFPVVESSLTMYGDSVTFSNAGKAFSISGLDYKDDGSTLGTHPAVYGMGVYQQKSVDQLKNFINNAGVASNVDGKGGTPSVGLFTNKDLIDSLHNMYKGLATITLPAGKYSGNATWGTASSPEIVYVNGDLEWTGNISGYGILVVSGDLIAKGTVTWKGITIAYSGDMDMQVGSSGTPNFLGTCFIGTGNASKITSVHFNGNPYIRYSYDVLQNVLTKLNLLQIEIISYYE